MRPLAGIDNTTNGVGVHVKAEGAVMMPCTTLTPHHLQNFLPTNVLPAGCSCTLYAADKLQRPFDTVPQAAAGLAERLKDTQVLQGDPNAGFKSSNS